VAVTPHAQVKVFVAARGNGFMTDVATMIHEAAATHRRSTLVTDELPTDDGSINLVVATTRPRPTALSPSASSKSTLARSSAAMPGTTSSSAPVT
jgi:hypothetical protein